MARKRGLFPLFLLLLSLSLLFIFSLYPSSLPLSTPTKFIQPPKYPHTQNTHNFTLTLKVLTYDRLPSLSRCLHSLAAANYDTDIVNLHIFIDHFKILDQPVTNLEKKLNESRQILDFVDGFVWRFGEKLVHYRTGNVGLQAQWLEAWWPVSDNDFAFIVEDDIEVSPLYYRFLRGLIVSYYYNASNFSPWIYGASLQRPRFVPGKHGNKMNLDEETRLFLYQLVGTWGQLLFPRPWKEFCLWYDTHKAKGMKPILDGMVTTGWYKKMGERIWTPWFINFIHSRGYYNIYTNFLHERALSVSHRDAGVNYGKTVGPDSYLLEDGSLDNNNLLEMKPLSNLKWYDFCFREVLPDRIVSSFDKLGPVLNSVQKLDTLVLVSLYGASETITRNLLCHFERLNIQNYIFMGPNSSLLLDLARRGHPVIDVDKFMDNIMVYKSMRFKESKLELIKEILAKAFFIKKSLENRYNTWVLDPHMLPLKNDSFLDSFDRADDFYVGKSFRLFFVRRSSSGWTDDFMREIAQMIDSMIKKDSSSLDDGNFVLAVSTLLEMKGVKIRRVEEINFGVKIDDSRNVDGTSLWDGKKVAFWSSDMGLDLVWKRLEKLGLWIVDEESHCTAVTCYPS